MNLLEVGDGLELPDVLMPPSATQMGVRPEHLAPVAQGAGHLRGEVEVVERLGSDSFVYVQVPGTGRLLSRCTGNTSLRAGEPVELALDLQQLHLFDELGTALRSQ